MTFERSTFAGVVWNGAPGDGRSGLVLSGVRFVDSDFHFGWFARTSTVRLEVVNCSFSGSDLDVTNFGLARFVSKRSDERLITDEVTVIENSAITNRVNPIYS